ncbi:MmgE/PrpD family protein [Bordetella hinzii]|nr:MmgE/PrpD family protein [Bordetella hinzii]
MPQRRQMVTPSQEQAVPAGDAAGAADFAEVLADFGAGLGLEALEAPVVQAVKTNVHDTLACAVAGSSAAGIAALRELAGEWGGAPQATIWVHGLKVPAHHAAWVNGAMAHARDYDDTHDAAVLHAGVSVVPAALAAAELAGGASGADFIAAVAAGLETICRLGVATRIGIVESGYMYTSLFGHFAATVAASRVLGLSPGQTLNAIGIGYSQVAGNHQVTRDGALTKRMQPGFAAKAALVSAQMARRGIRGAQATFEGLDGFLRVYLRGACDRAALREGLGRRYELLNLSYKPYPCCRLNHTGIDAVAALRRRHAIAPADIESLRVGLNRQAYEAVCTPPAVRRAPQSTVQAQFSLPYAVAAALVDGAVTLAHFEADAWRREDLLAVAARVQPYVDDALERDWGRGVSPALLELRLRDGTVLRERVDRPEGDPARPMTRAARDAKAGDCFAASALRFAADAPGHLRELVMDLETLGDVRELAAAMVARR